MSYVQQLRMEKEQMLVISGPIYVFQPQKSYSGHVYSFLNFFWGGGGDFSQFTVDWRQNNTANN